MQFSEALLFLASALPAVVLAEVQGSLHVPPAVIEHGKRSLSPLHRRHYTFTPKPCTPGDDTPCIPKGVIPHTPKTCNIPVTNDDRFISTDAILRNGYPFCDPDFALCNCSVQGLSQDVIIEVCREIISRHDPSLHIVDGCLNGNDGYCDYAGASFADFSGTDVKDVPSVWDCVKGKYVGDYTPGSPPS
ncbi:unnamed protein product [Zymoseptoria tritici ST99CH_1A5]|uniref:Uncharacterized protein n=4 Tax=Zymoseptoria tritici TaxID=1047171 RepID=F9XE31_ZYMTI|nr:uncharacterized protein MYCGRDRAFT_93609 [Zymoseptoria tritici IPO323]SMQ51383.1 unnamed protein product [Zymoseptoria tritici ST99CH_3D7]SMR53397.1 unnamed protein product [Zymoseptoria tritici ST99CH_1E4]SMR55836.1 unnamed protein product [Zymoseptoria tritici ST99CH_3D1]SMY25023.1 unnamed protein product [Zymoseptoria tritici ST99CH_1A5]EGP86981.1 hypothetical protein MYCGRDRAFT_93609 [Zymoseptoria tritici IPO323]